jgi:hypothetical protein
MLMMGSRFCDQRVPDLHLMLLQIQPFRQSLTVLIGWIFGLLKQCFQLALLLFTVHGALLPQPPREA